MTKVIKNWPPGLSSDIYDRIKQGCELDSEKVITAQVNNVFDVLIASIQQDVEKARKKCLA